MQRITFLLATLVVMLGTTASLLAQIPPKPPPPDSSSPLRSYGVAAVLIAGVCVGAMKSSKRTHQD